MSTVKPASALRFHETPFGTLSLSRDFPQVGRLYGFETGHNNRQFLGRSRLPQARTDLFIEFVPAQTLQLPLVGWVSVHQILMLSTNQPERSRLLRFTIERTRINPTLEFGLFTARNGDDGERDDPNSEGHELHRTSSIPDLLAVALLAAG